MEKRNDKPYQYWLHNLPGIGDRTIKKLLDVFGSPRQIYRTGEKRLREVLLPGQVQTVIAHKKVWDLTGAYQQLEEKEIRFFTLQDQEFPDRLRRLSHPPYGIYCKGNLPDPQAPAAALIGARECSEYGRSMAKAFGKAFGQAGVALISGMARGIDGIGQQAALEGGGRTYAVLGCGVDICYPASNRQLYDSILKQGGGILSVFPPGTDPRKGNFPERNRIVAGLSDLILVVEARQKSGTWITVDMALEQGKEVYAVPGRLSDRLSDGCNLLLRQGAGIALSPTDLLTELAVLRNQQKITDRSVSCEKSSVGIKWIDGEKETQERDASKSMSWLLALLDFTPISPDQLLERMREKGIQMELPELLQELVKLCMEGRVCHVSGNLFYKREGGI